MSGSEPAIVQIPTRQQAIDHILGFAERALAAGDHARAREVFLDVLLLEPRHPTALRGLAAMSAPALVEDVSASSG